MGPKNNANSSGGKKYMKAIIPITIVIIAFLCFAIWMQNSLNNTAQDMAKHLEVVEGAVLTEDWDLASNEMEIAQRKWDNVKKRWQMLIDHQEIDNIESTLVRVQSWIDLEGRDDCLTELATLKLFVLHIPEREAFRLTNIF